MGIRRYRLSLAVVVVALLFTGPAQANLLSNSGFQTGDLTDWTTYTTPNGTIGTPLVEVFDTTGLGPSRSAQFVVGQVLSVGALQRGGGIFQNVFMPADDNLTIWVNVASVGTSVSGNADGGVVSLMLDGSTISMHDFGNVAQDAIERVTLSLTLAVSAGSHEIRVQMVREFPTNDGTPRLYLDNIRALTDAQLLTGPEPLPLLAVLALGLWGAQRRLR